MERTDLALHPNEASDLSPVFDPATLDRLGWDRALVTVLDEVAGDECLAILGHDADAAIARGWHAKRIPTKAGREAGRTQDAESIARHDGCLYVLGSQFGKNRGPLQASRSWIGRVKEREVAAWLIDEGVRRPKMQIARLRFGLHRAINDALAASPVALAEPGPLTTVRYVEQTMLRGIAQDKSWKARIHARDLPVNVEGACFRPNGRLLLGLRYPVTREGAPLIVELDDVDAVFAGRDPVCSAVWWLEGVGRFDRPVGLRAIHDVGPDRFEAIVGNLDATDKDSTIVEDDPRAGLATSVHVAFDLPALARGGAVGTRVVHRFAGQTRVEGLATSDGHLHYVTDEDGHLGLHSLLAEAASG